MKNKKINKIVIPVIAGALMLGTLTTTAYADPSAADNDYQIIIIEKDPETGKYIKRVEWVEHEYYSTTGFCDICNLTINEGNHTNKITGSDKDGIVKDKEDGGIPELPEANVVVQSLKMNGKTIDIACKSGTYKEVFDYIKNQGYSDFTVKNFWGTQVFSWYNINESGKCEVFINDTEKTETEDTKTIIQTLKMNGKTIDIACKSGTYKEVFDYIKNQGYSNFTVKNFWNTTVYSWYNISENGKCEVFLN